MPFFRRHIFSEFVRITAQIFICFVISWHCNPSFVTAFRLCHLPLREGLVIVQLEHRHECFLRKLDGTYAAHFLFTFLLFFKKLFLS